MGGDYIHAIDAGAVPAWVVGLSAWVATYDHSNLAVLLSRRSGRLLFSFADAGSGQWPSWSLL